MNEQKGISLVFFTAVVSGFSIFINKFGVSGLNPYAFAGMKNALVAIFLLSTLFLLGEFSSLIKLKRKQWLYLLSIGFFGGSVPFLLFFRGLQLTSAATAAFIHKSMFIYAAIMASILLKEKLNKRFLLASVLLLAGNAILLKLSWLSFDAGALMVFIATVLWAVENTISKRVLRELTPRVVAFGRMFFGSAFILSFLAITGQAGAIFAVGLSQLSWVFVTSLFLMFYVYSWYHGLKHLKVSVATSMLLFGSVVTTALSLAFGGVVVSLNAAVGVLLLLAGIVTAVGIPQILGSMRFAIASGRKHVWNA